VEKSSWSLWGREAIRFERLARSAAGRDGGRIGGVPLAPWNSAFAVAATPKAAGISADTEARRRRIEEGGADETKGQGTGKQADVTAGEASAIAGVR
jgi:hypothetical protein